MSTVYFLSRRSGWGKTSLKFGSENLVSGELQFWENLRLNLLVSSILLDLILIIQQPID
jgi:hypothetical protein